MKKRTLSPCCVRRGFLAIALAALPMLALPLSAQFRPTHRSDFPDFDRRAPIPQDSTLAAERAQAEAQLRQQVPAVQVDRDDLLGAPKFIRAHDGFLTGPGGQGRAVSPKAANAARSSDPHATIKAFLDEHSALFGHDARLLDTARVKRDYVDAHNGLRTTAWEQRLDGIPVFRAVLMGHVTRAGELTSLSSMFVPNAGVAADAATPNRQSIQSAPPISAARAVLLGARNLGTALQEADVVATGGPVGDGDYLPFKTPEAAYTRLVWLPLHRGALRLAWETIVDQRSAHERFLLVVDALTGEVLLRNCISAHLSDATYNIFPSDSPSPFSPSLQTPGTFQPPLVNRTLITTPALDTNASPAGWIPDGANTTTGNNVDAFVDRNFTGIPDRPRPVGNPFRVFDFPMNLAVDDPSNYIDASTVQLFYKGNVYHDRLYQLGFTEAAGNYQDDNFGRGGIGNDHVIAYVQAGADLGIANNSMFQAAPDGISGQCYMFIFDFPTPNRDGAQDSEVVFHEFTHGTSWRLVGGGFGLGNLQGDGMGEGWSDFYALCLLSENGDNPDLAYASGGYASYRIFGLTENYYFGIRHFPYCTDMLKNPFTFKDIDPAQISAHAGIPRSPLYPFDPLEANEVHHQGEVWCSALWEVHANLVKKYGWAIGNQLTLQLVTDGMKLTPGLPNFLQARDAIVMADRIDNAGVNVGDIWLGFAKRGMGASATSPNGNTTTGVHEAFDTPGLFVDHTVVLGGNGNGVIDPNECDDLQIFLANNQGFLATGVSARLSSSTPGVIITQPFSGYPDIPNNATNANFNFYKISIAPYFVCGTPIDLTLAIKSDQSTTTNSFRLTTGFPLAPIRFDNPNPVAIPDNDPLGTNSIVVVSNMTAAVTKVVVSLFITHTFDQDLTLQLISPDGLTNTLSAHHGLNGKNYGVNCTPDSQRTTFDDAATNLISLATPPFIGAFVPDQLLAVFNGKFDTNLNGIWRLHLVDDAQFDVGTLQCWSLFLYSASCTDGGGECPGADLSVGMTAVPEPVIVGNNLVYTINVTNLGPSTAKNVVVTHLLPAGAIFVSGASSQGTVGQAGGVVTANLGSMNAGRTATVTVSILPTIAGVASSSATVSSEQPDFNTANNTVTVFSHVNPPTADLAVGLVAVPNNVVLGASSVLTVSVTNNGPGFASAVTVSNFLPASVTILSTAVSQGSVQVLGNVVICSFGTLTNGSYALGSITVTPNQEGQAITAATAFANQFDPVGANNSASAAITVGPACDLAIGLTGSLNPVVVGSNLDYTINVTNLGPSIASGIVINDFLPPGVTVVSNFTTRGSNVLSGNTLTCNVDSLLRSEVVKVIIRVTYPTANTIVNSASVSGAQADPFGANNTASISTRVALPFVQVATAGATLTGESFYPTNGAIDIGETVTNVLRLRNAGNILAVNVSAVLLATNGVIPGVLFSNYYNLLPASGTPVGKPFSFTATGTNGGTISPVLAVRFTAGGEVTTTNISFTFVLPTTRTFTNPAPIAIRDLASALPYPSTIAVSGLTGVVSKVTATLIDASHTFPQDIDALLKAPLGQNSILLSGAGAPPLADATVTFDDSASAPVPDGSAQIFSGSYRPAAYTTLSLPAPAPGAPYPAAMSTFNAADPNGTWSLYVADHSGGDTGRIAGGWSLAVTTITPINQLADLIVTGAASPQPALAGSNITYVFTVTNSGPSTANLLAFSDALPTGLALVSYTNSVGAAMTVDGNLITANLGTLATGVTATVTIIVNPGAANAGTLVNTATVAANETDLNLVNNSASVITTVGLPIADVGVSQTAAPDPVLTGSNIVFAVTVTNRGPGLALDVALTNLIPAGATFIPGTSTSPVFTGAPGMLIYQVGTLAPNAAAVFNVAFRTGAAGLLTNTALAGTTSTDNQPDNSFTYVAVVANPAPQMVPATTNLVAESFLPPDGTIESNEVVTVAFGLRNVGTANTTNLVATLLPTGGVTPIDAGPKSYGALVVNGPSHSANFSFQASVPNGGVLVATLQVTEGTFSNIVSFAFTAPSRNSFTNSTGIIIPDHGAAQPYPSSIAVSGMTGQVSKATVTLFGLSHSFPRDVNVLLVNPAGTEVLLMSHAGGSHSLTNITLTFDDSAANSLPGTNAITSDSYRPTAYGSAPVFPSPAPGGTPASTLSAFNAANPNGLWSLYVLDDSVGDAGAISGGWSLSLTAISPINPLADLALSLASAPSSIFADSWYTNSLSLTNLGPATATSVTVTSVLPVGVTFVSAPFVSQGGITLLGNTLVWDLGTNLASGASASARIILSPSLPGTLLNMALATAAQVDINPANNSAASPVSIISPAPIRLSGFITNAAFHLNLLAQPGLTYRIEASSTFSNWVQIGQSTASQGGTIKFVDPTPATNRTRFYRAVRLVP